MSNVEKIVHDALGLESKDKILLLDKLLASFYPLSEGVEKVWNKEAEERIDSYEQGNLPSLNAEDTFAKYKR